MKKTALIFIIALSIILSACGTGSVAKKDFLELMDSLPDVENFSLEYSSDVYAAELAYSELTDSEKTSKNVKTAKEKLDNLQLRLVELENIKAFLQLASVLPNENYIKTSDAQNLSTAELAYLNLTSTEKLDSEVVLAKEKIDILKVKLTALEQAISAMFAEIDEAVAGFEGSNYRTEEWTMIQNLIASAKSYLNNQSDISSINAYSYVALLTDISNVPTKDKVPTITLDMENFSIYIAESQTITAQTNNISGNLLWTISNANLGTLTVDDEDNSCLFLANGFGSVTLTASFENTKTSITITIEREKTPTGTAISTPSELLGIQPNGNYTLSCDIDLKDVKFNSRNDSIQSFSGVLDGKGYSILNYYSKLPATNKGNEEGALFFTLSGTVKNLNIIDAKMVCLGYSAVLARTLNSGGIIENVYLKGNTTNGRTGGADYYAGTLVATANSGCTIRNVVVEVVPALAGENSYCVYPIIGRRYGTSTIENVLAIVLDSKTSLDMTATKGAQESTGKLETDIYFGYRTMQEFLSGGKFSSPTFDASIWDFENIRVKIQA